MSKKPATIWAYDCETLPFKYGRPPVPFAWCAVSEHGDRFVAWGKNATAEFISFLHEQKSGLFIAHNGGKFDNLFLKDEIHGPILLVDGRIIKCKIGKVELRDSFAILPMALSNMKTASGTKSEIDYWKFEDEHREHYRAEITRYLIQDCEVLLSAVLDFYQRAGKRRLTIASQASAELRAIYPDLPKMDATHDAEFRPFYFGGRVQAFEKGIITGRFSMYDRNSMYPAVMAQEYHPFGAAYSIKSYSIKNLPDDNCGFFRGYGDSLGAFPIRLQDKTTPYLHGRVDIACTLHEIRAALECGLVSNLSGELIIPANKTKFDKFVLSHYASRNKARAINDDGGNIYHKLILNSSSGRFAMSPDGRDECYFAEHGEDINPMLRDGWRVADIDMESERFILKRPPQRPWQFYEDVATGSSITGASRANLLRVIAASKRVLYCDTDSVLCEEFGGGKIGGKELGDWKHEGDFDQAAIAGKKTYALYKGWECIKQACKGVKAAPSDIYRAAAGETVEIFRDAPTMRLGGVSFVARKIRKT